MNKELLLKIKEQILKEPTRFYMGDWNYNCGTAHCIGGWASVLSGRTPLSAIESFRGGTSEQQIAAELLRLDYTTASALFHVSSWPPTFKNAYYVIEDKDDRTNRNQALAEVAAQRIDHFIATEGRE